MSLSSFVLAQSQSPFGNPVFAIGLMIIMFYFLIIRPQRKQRKDQEERISAMKKGDKVVTIGGMHGIIHHISKETVTLKISEGVFVPFNKPSIATVESSKKASANESDKKTDVKENDKKEATETSEKKEA